MKGPVSVGITRPHIRLSQGTVVVGAMFAAWILWLAVNNKLVVYWQILIGQGGATANQAANTVVNNPISTTGQPTTGTASGTVSEVSPIAASNASAALVGGVTGF